MTDFPQAAGVYCLKHRKTGDCYVGSSINLKSRIRSHIGAIADHSCPRIADLVRREGPDFEFSVLEVADNYVERERHWIATLNPSLNTHKKPGARKRPLKTLVAVAARIKGETFEAIQEIAQSEDRTVSYVVARAIREFVERRTAP
jgi:group I intron endonuclease